MAGSDYILRGGCYIPSIGQTYPFVYIHPMGGSEIDAFAVFGPSLRDYGIISFMNPFLFEPSSFDVRDVGRKVAAAASMFSPHVTFVVCVYTPTNNSARVYDDLGVGIVGWSGCRRTVAELICKGMEELSKNGECRRIT